MNAEFVEKMLRAKRLEAEAFASIVPEGARRVAAVAVRACSEAVLEVLDEPSAASARVGENRPVTPAGSPKQRSDLRTIDID